MYFKARNGTYKRVPQIPNRYLDGEVGGMTVYYTTPYDGSKSTAFKPVSTPGLLSRHFGRSTLSNRSFRASVCLLAWLIREHQAVSRNTMQSAFDATMHLTLEGIIKPHARTAQSTAWIYQKKLAQEVFVQQSDSQRRLLV